MQDNQLSRQTKYIHKKAFTLAEVLITLAIIGVVAAITIPTLLKNIQDAQFKNAAKEAFSKASQAIQLMKNDNGGSVSSYIGTYQTFKPVFINYFKVNKDCNWSDCQNATNSNYKSLYNNLGTGWYFGNGEFVSTDGMFWSIFNTASPMGDGKYHIFISVDVNGYVNGPNIYGKDAFIFELIDDNLVPMGGNNTYWLATAKCIKNPYPSNNINGFGCMYYVMTGVDY